MDEYRREAEKPLGDPERSRSSARLAGFLLETSFSIAFFVITCNIVLFLAGILLLDLLFSRNWIIWVVVLPLLLLSLLVLAASAMQMWGKVKNRLK